MENSHPQLAILTVLQEERNENNRDFRNNCTPHSMSLYFTGTMDHCMHCKHGLGLALGLGLGVTLRLLVYFPKSDYCTEYPIEYPIEQEPVNHK